MHSNNKKQLSLALFIVVMSTILIHSCQKGSEVIPVKQGNVPQKRSENLNESAINEPQSNKKASDQYVEFESYWTGTIPKSEFTSRLGNLSNQDLNRIDGMLPENITYLLVVENGHLEEYFELKGNGNRFAKLSKHPTMNNVSENGIDKHDLMVENLSSGVLEKLIEVVENKGGNEVKFNDHILNGVAHRLENRSIVVHENPLPITCCNACYAVHDFLGLHMADCICCLLSCGFSCSGLDAPDTPDHN